MILYYKYLQKSTPTLVLHNELIILERYNTPKLLYYRLKVKALYLRIFLSQKGCGGQKLAAL